ncbi:hypothetical protein HCN51_01075 [Nonomuraea sp. FMUSA5-5]|uniref:Uncharacterized protein n=1 Tax=Nonomuraea composti TaxID=2720023 RepID=A0ABX1AT35_9ACTN|nr:hypothetical protein [Nonomuraea sp. FMUSA5-5]NJP88061.1 hypothetical protein [Nonomuraea sp. FMUSA5-5]
MRAVWWWAVQHEGGPGTNTVRARTDGRAASTGGSANANGVAVSGVAVSGAGAGGE